MQKRQPAGKPTFTGSLGLLSRTLAHNEDIPPFLSLPPPNSLTLEIEFLTHKVGAGVGQP